MMKRVFDIGFSLVALACLVPVLGLVALVVKASSPGPLFFRSQRVGRGGKIFGCLKFRTMFADAEKRLEEMLQKDPALKKEWETFWKLKEDPRITPVGRFLRKTSLDELPQFWNVLMGELSVVGPRPITQEEVKRYYGDKAEKILSLRPGVTGLWQTSGRNLLSFEERVLLEERYVDTHSFLLDLKLILKTIPSMISCKGAY
jgi:undecaprenyl-phosphate galactose phosphotransferase